MPLSEKELETFLWEHPATCEARGLRMNRHFYSGGRRYRRLSLGPYGVASLVYVRYWPPEHAYYVQVFVLSKAAISLAHYQQAKRYQTALRDALGQALRAAGLTATVNTNSVLLGQCVQLKGDLVYLLNLDASCQAFTCTYEVGGIRFEDVGKTWHHQGSEQSPALVELAADLLSHREEALADGNSWPVLEAAQELVQDYSDSLVITAEGVMENRALLPPAEEGLAEHE